MSDLPEVKEIERLRIEPGDRLIIHVDGVISREQADEITNRVRSILKLVNEIPIIITPTQMTFKVVQSEEVKAE